MEVLRSPAWPRSCLTSGAARRSRASKCRPLDPHSFSPPGAPFRCAQRCSWSLGVWVDATTFFGYTKCRGAANVGCLSQLCGLPAGFSPWPEPAGGCLNPDGLCPVLTFAGRIHDDRATTIDTSSRAPAGLFFCAEAFNPARPICTKKIICGKKYFLQLETPVQHRARLPAGFRDLVRTALQETTAKPRRTPSRGASSNKTAGMLQTELPRHQRALRDRQPRPDRLSSP